MTENIDTALGSLEIYAKLILSGLGFMLAAMVIVFVLYRAVSSFVKPTGKFARMVRVAFGAIYVLILLLAVSLAAESLGYDVASFTGIGILLVITGAVVVFFLIPFLPRVPFNVGDLVSIRGHMGNIEAITSYQTVLRTFDGRLIYIPNVLTFSTDIENYSTVPNRRVDVSIQIHAHDNLEAGRQLMLDAMLSDDRVRADPAPSVFVTNIDKGLVTLQAYCWTTNADWFPTRDALIVDITGRLQRADDVELALYEVAVRNIDL
ncbi:mechanosensitive ion channel family protein [Congregibacter sp.]|uniref:mechanosensitive ion channel family protein n=1 Tax=Congregibacter sp. TaxID=2744308 RepID=UPI003858FA8C